ncbi:MAG: hypothetical protein CVV32_04325 [Methanomicrobiales archaeon HGW-Methanomicrobiales-3]|jgi:hypothetical protein|nr:MAG: hypothetical protein CVV32_04325 [Methanomicrobiales archaeon HGW-Methanomicrobiales-3]
MDRIIKITLGLFFAILILTIAFAGYTTYVSGAYEATRTATTSYTLSISTDHPLTDATFFIPVPADISGNSPVVAAFSAREMTGVPASWETTLFDTGKATLLKIHIPELIPPAGTGPDNPYTVTIAAELPAGMTIDTLYPVETSPVYGTIRDLTKVACTGSFAGSPRCFTFTTSLYADYTADPNTAVTIKSAVTGTNRWTVFEPRFNEYTTGFSVLMHGENNGWTTAKGTLVSTIGSYDYPFTLA